MTDLASEPRTDLPSPARRRRLGALIAVYLLVQLGLPLRYYLSEARGDERFAWRMFSALRFQTCSLSLVERIRDGGREKSRTADPHRLVHDGWTRELEKDLPIVVDRFLARRCAADPRVVEVSLGRSCHGPDGALVPTEPRVLRCPGP
jgi:hypothetical protein